MKEEQNIELKVQMKKDKSIFKQQNQSQVLSFYMSTSVAPACGKLVVKCAVVMVGAERKHRYSLDRVTAGQTSYKGPCVLATNGQAFPPFHL